jgi:hypothetical protein
MKAKRAISHSLDAGLCQDGPWHIFCSCTNHAQSLPAYFLFFMTSCDRNSLNLKLLLLMISFCFTLSIKLDETLLLCYLYLKDEKSVIFLSTGTKNCHELTLFYLKNWVFTRPRLFSTAGKQKRVKKTSIAATPTAYRHVRMRPEKQLAPISCCGDWGKPLGIYLYVII